MNATTNKSSTNPARAMRATKEQIQEAMQRVAAKLPATLDADAAIMEHIAEALELARDRAPRGWNIRDSVEELLVEVQRRAAMYWRAHDEVTMPEGQQ